MVGIELQMIGSRLYAEEKTNVLTSIKDDNEKFNVSELLGLNSFLDVKYDNVDIPLVEILYTFQGNEPFFDKLVEKYSDIDWDKVDNVVKDWVRAVLGLINTVDCKNFRAFFSKYMSKPQGQLEEIEINTLSSFSIMYGFPLDSTKIGLSFYDSFSKLARNYKKHIDFFNKEIETYLESDDETLKQIILNSINAMINVLNYGYISADYYMSAVCGISMSVYNDLCKVSTFDDKTRTFKFFGCAGLVGYPLNFFKIVAEKFPDCNFRSRWYIDNIQRCGLLYFVDKTAYAVRFKDKKNYEEIRARVEGESKK